MVNMLSHIGLLPHHYSFVFLSEKNVAGLVLKCLSISVEFFFNPLPIYTPYMLHSQGVPEPGLLAYEFFIQ